MKRMPILIVLLLSLLIRLEAANADPVLTVNPSQAVTEQQTLTLFSAATIADSDTNDMNRLQVKVENPVSGDVIGYTLPAGFSASGTTDLEFSGTFDKGIYQTLLQSITFNPGSDAPGTTRIITVQVRDKDNGSSAIAKVTVTITLLNDAPTIPSTTLDRSTDEDQAKDISFEDLIAGASDPDGGVPNLRVMSVAPVALGSLQKVVGTVVAPAIPGTDLASTQKLRWTPAPDVVDEGGTVAFTVAARDSERSSSDVRSVRMKVIHVCDISKFEEPLSYILGSGRKHLSNLADRLTLAAADKPLIVRAGSKLVARVSGQAIENVLQIVSITSPSLTLTLGSGSRILRSGIDIAGWSGDGVSSPLEITFTSLATADDIENVSLCIAYDNTFDANGLMGTRQVTLSFHESGRPASESQIKVVNLFPPNKKPVIELGTSAKPPRPFAAPPNGSAIIHAIHLRAVDPDDPPPAKFPGNLTFTIISSPAYGSLRLLVGGLPVTLGLNGQFTQLDIDANRLSYLHRGGTIPTDSIGLRVHEAGQFGLVSDNSTFLVDIGVSKGLAIISDPIMSAILDKKVSHLITLAGASGAQLTIVKVRIPANPGSVPTEIGRIDSAGDGIHFIWTHIFTAAGLQPIEVAVELSGLIIIQPMLVNVVDDATSGG